MLQGTYITYKLSKWFPVCGRSWIRLQTDTEQMLLTPVTVWMSLSFTIFVVLCITILLAFDITKSSIIQSLCLKWNYLMSYLSTCTCSFDVTAPSGRRKLRIFLCFMLVTKPSKCKLLNQLLKSRCYYKRFASAILGAAQTPKRANDRELYNKK